ncbi:MAG: DnaJ domain-containing protein [Bdellovibrionales bacterium]|nr:DnaJ domain-containing protein [Bdellovibrionales bacterium]
MFRWIILIAFVIFILRSFKKAVFTASSTSTTSTPKDPYEVLHIPKNASQDEIRKAYLFELSQNHPDKVAHLSEEIQKTAQRKTQDIQWAYQQLKNR